jgi:glycosyltransferase 2 family protein
VTYFAAKSLALDVPLLAVVAFAPAVAAIQVLPISLGGLGVRETAFAVLFAPFGVSNGEALGLGLLVYAMTLTASLAGAPSFAAGSRHPGRRRMEPRPPRQPRTRRAHEAPGTVR